MLVMENPGLRTLLSFLNHVRRLAPASFSKLCEGRQRGYGMVSRYIGFCVDHGLIRVVSERRTRGKYPSREYELSEKGLVFLEIFDLKPTQSTKTHPTRSDGRGDYRKR